MTSGAAYTDGFTLEIGIGQDQYNTGNTLMSVGIVLLEVSQVFLVSKLRSKIHETSSRVI